MILVENGLDHIGFIVKDLEKAVNHFKNYYGIDNFTVYSYSPTKVWSYGKEVKNYKLKIDMAYFEKGSGIEIIQPVEGEGVHKDFINSGNSGMHHLAFA